jgi:DNA integrity scanning protein DisA with diadenylate cyclase activity/mannitol/fructose-specific phosphotransferase system IIA component (Ntr-type)
MRIDQLITRGRIVELHSLDLEGALKELLDVSVVRFPDLKHESVLRGLLARESTMTTYLGNGVALPHVRVKMPRRYVLAIGRSRLGIRHDGSITEDRVRIIVMLIAGEHARDYLQVLACVARLMKEPDLVEGLASAPDLDTLHERLLGGLGGIRPVQALQNKVNRLMQREAERVAAGAGCGALMVFGDTFVGGIEQGALNSRMRTILVSRNPAEPALGDARSERVSTIQVRSYSRQRLAQLRSALLVALMRGVISFDDRVCCLGGMTGSNQFDTLVVADVEREFQALITGSKDLLPEDVTPEVLERVVAVATELAVEGREGRPVGCLFVVGAHARVQEFTKPLVLNPFYGYKEEDRNILNPFMDETIKEFSSLDGAFLIRGDGVVESAGSLVQAGEVDYTLPSGLGSRHAAAAAISVAAPCIAIVVSSSTGQVTLFRRGVMLPLTEKKMTAGV